MAPICAFYHHSLGGFSIVSVQTCLLRFRSGSKVGQNFLTGGFQSGNVIHQSIPTEGLSIEPYHKVREKKEIFLKLRTMWYDL